MTNAVDILYQFPKASFWDVEVSKLDIQADSDFIIPRALYMSTAKTFEEDIHRLEKLYPSSQIIETLKTTKERISDSTCALVAMHYHIPTFSRFSR